MVKQLSALGITVLLASAVLTGCQQTTEPDNPTTPVPTASEPTVSHKIAALSYDVAETVAALGLADSLVLVPASAKIESMTNYPTELAKVSNELATEADIDPERILASGADLVLITPRQRGDVDSNKLLESLTVPVVSIKNSWSTLDDVLANLKTIGDELGVPNKADELISKIQTELNGVVPAAKGLEVLVLSNQQQPFLVGSQAFPSYLVSLTGATLSSTKLAVERTRPVESEQVVKADPDAIILIDLHGTKMTAYEKLLSNPAIASLDAVKENKVLLLQGREIQALGLAELGSTANKINDWLAEFTK